VSEKISIVLFCFFSLGFMELSFHLCPSHFPPQHVGAEFHAAEGEPFLAQVLQRGTDMIYCVVNAEEAIDEEAFRYSLFGA